MPLECGIPMVLVFVIGYIVMGFTSVWNHEPVSLSHNLQHSWDSQARGLPASPKKPPMQSQPGHAFFWSWKGGGKHPGLHQTCKYYQCVMSMVFFYAVNQLSGLGCCVHL